MKRTGATLAVHALEEFSVEHTFGISGVHNTELYDALGASEQIEPLLVTHEGGGAFMADGVSRTSDQAGTLVIVPAAVPAAQNAFETCDALLAVGARFGELATGSYGMEVPDTLVHVDINPEVFDKNEPATVAIEGDAQLVCRRLLDALQARPWRAPRRREALADQIRQDKADYRSQWMDVQSDTLVSPGPFFAALRTHLDDDAQLVVDDGKHTFLAAELFPVQRPRGFISPTDFNCMGYCMPAAVGAKLAHPEWPVAAIVGDGAFLMTGMELLTAANYDLGVMAFVFHDGELGQISQFQSIPLNRKTRTQLSDMKIEGVAEATGSHYVRMETDADIEPALEETQSVTATGRLVIIDVNIDYRRRTQMTKGVVKTNLSRFSTSEKIRFVVRAAKRHLFG
jgi:acetolactate synthase-1/2/3 large subunit